MPSPDAMALAAIAPATLRVDVENGSGVPAPAVAWRRTCSKAGFTIGQVGNADRSDYSDTEIHEHSTVTFAGARVRAALADRARIRRPWFRIRHRARSTDRQRRDQRRHGDRRQRSVQSPPLGSADHS